MVVAVVVQVALELAHAAGDLRNPGFVQHAPFVGGLPVPGALPPQPDFSVWVPSSVAHPGAQIRGQPRQRPSVEWKFVGRGGAGFPRHQFLQEVVAQGFVGVQAQHVGVGSLVGRPIFLVGVRGEGALVDRGAKMRAHVQCPVRGAGVHHHHFVGQPLHGFQTTGQVVGLVFGNDDNAQHRNEGSPEVRVLWITSRPVPERDGVILRA